MIGPSGNLALRHLLQRVVSFGMGYLGYRNVCLLGGTALLAGAIAIFRSRSSCITFPRNREINNRMTSPKEAFQNEVCILKFVTDARAANLILEGRAKKQNLHFLAKAEIQQFGETYPTCSEVQAYVNASLNAQEVPNESMVTPFVTLGIMDTSWIDDPEVVTTIRSFQVRIFKYWHSLYQTSPDEFLQPGRDLLIDLFAFCNSSSLKVFSQHIGPFLQSFVDNERGYDEVIYFFLGGEWIKEESSVDESSTDEESIPLSSHLKELQSQIARQIGEQISQQVAAMESQKTQGEKLVESFACALRDTYPSHAALGAAVDEEHFSKAAITRLFLEITTSS